MPCTHVLILDGVEKVERNILPTINNLLENREMTLEDGRILTNSYSHTTNSSDKNIVPIHPNFCVIAMGLPCPPYSGRSLDPPLRSRFQARFIEELQATSMIDLLSAEIHQLDDTNRDTIFNIFEALKVIRDISISDSNGTSMTSVPIFSIEKMMYVLARLKHNPNELKPAVDSIIPPWLYKHIPENFQHMMALAIRSGGSTSSTSSSNTSSTSSNSNNHKLFKAQSKILDDMLVDRNISHKCQLILGDRGVGKSYLVNAYIDQTNQLDSYCKIIVNKEMTIKDILQLRSTDDVSGNTIRIDSPLVVAARTGKLVVLDNFDKLDVSIMPMLKRLMYDRTIDLPSGERLVCHPSFNIIAIAATTSSSSADARDRYIMSDLPFSYHQLDGKHVLQEVVDSLTSSVSGSHSSIISMLSSNKNLSLSLRQIMRLKKVIHANASTSIASADTTNEVIDAIEGMLLVPFLPKTIREQFHRLLKRPPGARRQPRRDLIVTDKTLQAGDIMIERKHTTTDDGNKKLIEFYSNDYQNNVLYKLIESMSVHKEKAILLIGNQGVGKNKIVDRLVELLGVSREYVQLHRDSTVSSLTMLPSLEGGKIHFKETPLLRAAINGHLLIVDEADKASVEVINVLKSIVDDGSILLPNGCRLINRQRDKSHSLPNDILIHPDFQLILLANRPGHPFHGNNFYHECGDVFAVHIVDNLDIQSEIQLLSQYGSKIKDKSVITKIAHVFQELRREYNKGDLLYPFSSRESVSIIRHFNEFPEDRIEEAIENVLSFDTLSPGVRTHITGIFNRIGGFNVPCTYSHIASTQVNRNDAFSAGASSRGHAEPKTGLAAPKHGRVDEKNEPHVGGNTWAGGMHLV